MNSSVFFGIQAGRPRSVIKDFMSGVGVSAAMEAVADTESAGVGKAGNCGDSSEVVAGGVAPSPLPSTTCGVASGSPLAVSEALLLPSSGGAGDWSDLTLALLIRQLVPYQRLFWNCPHLVTRRSASGSMSIVLGFVGCSFVFF